MFNKQLRLSAHLMLSLVRANSASDELANFVLLNTPAMPPRQRYSARSISGCQGGSKPRCDQCGLSRPNIASRAVAVANEIGNAAKRSGKIGLSSIFLSSLIPLPPSSTMANIPMAEEPEELRWETTDCVQRFNAAVAVGSLFLLLRQIGVIVCRSSGFCSFNYQVRTVTSLYGMLVNSFCTERVNFFVEF